MVQWRHNRWRSDVIVRWCSEAIIDGAVTSPSITTSLHQDVTAPSILWRYYTIYTMTSLHHLYYDVTAPSIMPSLHLLLWHHCTIYYNVTTPSILWRHCTIYYDVTAPSIMTSLYFLLWRHCTIYTMTSLHYLYYDVTAPSILWRRHNRWSMANEIDNIAARSRDISDVIVDGVVTL